MIIFQTLGPCSKNTSKEVLPVILLWTGFWKQETFGIPLQMLSMYI